MNDASAPRETAQPPVRTPWGNGSAMMRDYYDHEWGLPVTTEAGLYERVCLEGFQAGLSWATILSRREAFRQAFEGFDPEIVAGFTDEDVERLATNAAIIRSRAKIRAAVGNARATLALRDLDDPRLAGWSLPLTDGTVLEIDPGLPSLIWSYAPSTTPEPGSMADVPTQSPESRALCKELKSLGFSYVGPTTTYALMEAIGMVDTHWVESHQRGASRIFSPEARRAELIPRSGSANRLTDD